MVTISAPSPFEIIRDLGRYARRIVTDGTAREVLMMIADRTLGWNNPDEVITEDQFINGVYGRDGTMWHAGIGLGRTKLYECLKALQALKVITVRKIKRGRLMLNAYSLNLEWAVSLMAKVKVSKKAKAEPVKLRIRPVRNTDMASLIEGPAVRVADPKEEDPLISLEEEETSPPAAGISAAIGRGRALTAQRAEKRYQRYKDRIDPAKLYVEHWAPAVREAWPDAKLLPMTGKDRGQLRQFAEAWPDKSASVADFLEWAAVNWRSIHAAKFAFLEGKVVYPDFPDFGFLMGYKRAFLDSWSRRASLAQDTNLTEEQRLMKRLRFQGFTPDAAKAEFAKIMANRQAGKGLEAERQRLAELAETIEVRNRVVTGREGLQSGAAVAQTVPKIKQVRERPTIGSVPVWQDED